MDSDDNNGNVIVKLREYLCTYYPKKTSKSSYCKDSFVLGVIFNKLDESI